MRILSAVLAFALLYAASAAVYTTGKFYGHKGKVPTRHPVVLGKCLVFHVDLSYCVLFMSFCLTIA